MEDDVKRRLVYGLVSLVLTSLAAWLSTYITNAILGEPEDQITG